MKPTSTQPSDDKAESGPDNAPDDNISYLCMKYNRHQQGDRLACQDPGLYCKFRPQCLIHYMEKRRRRESDASDG
jgi:hypothetical protein